MDSCHQPVALITGGTGYHHSLPVIDGEPQEIFGGFQKMFPYRKTTAKALVHSHLQFIQNQY